LDNSFVLVFVQIISDTIQTGVSDCYRCLTRLVMRIFPPKNIRR